MFKIISFFVLIIYLALQAPTHAKNVSNIIVKGNDRISDETIIMFSKVNQNEVIDNNKLNLFLKNLYDTNFFENVSVYIDDKNLVIEVIEAPIIESITISGISAKKIESGIKNLLNLKSRSSYNEFLMSQEKQIIKNYLKDLGYYFADVTTIIKSLSNNLVDVEHKITLGNKSKIKKISFIGNKVFKDSKLSSLIISEEYKFWKFISGRKYMNEQTIIFDKRLLKNFYLNQGYYNVVINSSFGKLINEDEFELIFNIDAKNKIYFDNLSVSIPNDFDKNNFNDLNELLNNLKGKPYSLNSVDKILNRINLITLNEEFQSVEATVEETIIKNKLNIIFNIQETETYYVERINIFGNNITRENVIRNNLEIDEGDPYNEILQKRSENNLKSLNFFRKVSSEIIDGKQPNSKIININVVEKPTGEISAGAGAGTSGGTFLIGIKENNYLGKGLAVEANGTVTAETFKGLLSVTDPNYKNSDKSLYTNIQAIEIDRKSTNGYKTNKTGFEIGTNFEYYKNFNLGLSTRSFYEKIETDSTASSRQQSQEGDYWDTFLKFNFDYDKRNQKFKTSEGFRSTYSLDLPMISDTYTMTNKYNYKVFTELYNNNISTLSLLLHTANSIGGEDVKLTERLFLPSSRLRGFERGKVGPKDGSDFIGGNFAGAINFSSTLPLLFENTQNVDALLFIDVANIWGVDYDSSIDESDKIRSSIGIGVDWFTAIGPINFSLTEAISKADTDITESFRFNIGTTF